MVLQVVNVSEIMPFVKECGAPAWGKLRRLLGKDAAFELAHKKRNDIFISLRTDYGYTLQTIADVFSITRERVRQLTPPGLWATHSENIDWEAIINRVIDRAMANKSAWSSQGRIRRSWIADKFGKDVAAHMADAHRAFNKLEMILHFKLGLIDDDARLSWIGDQYFNHNKGYKEIASDLSRRGIYISTMAVFRCSKAMGFGGYQRGRRHDLPY